MISCTHLLFHPRGVKHSVCFFVCLFGLFLHFPALHLISLLPSLVHSAHAGGRLGELEGSNVIPGSASSRKMCSIKAGWAQWECPWQGVGWLTCPFGRDQLAFEVVERDDKLKATDQWLNIHHPVIPVQQSYKGSKQTRVICPSKLAFNL